MIGPGTTQCERTHLGRADGGLLEPRSAMVASPGGDTDRTGRHPAQPPAPKGDHVRGLKHLRMPGSNRTPAAIDAAVGSTVGKTDESVTDEQLGLGRTKGIVFESGECEPPGAKRGVPSAETSVRIIVLECERKFIDELNHLVADGSDAPGGLFDESDDELESLKLSTKSRLTKQDAREMSEA